MTSLDTLTPLAVDTLRGLSVDALLKVFNPGAVQRGLSYLSQGRVLGVHADHGSRLVAVVTGSGVRPYTVHIDLPVDSGDVVDGLCSCPVGADCKHVVAALLAARAALPGTARGVAGSGAAMSGVWERRLAGLTTEPVPPPP